jgi:hypothetical protein
MNSNNSKDNRLQSRPIQIIRQIKSSDIRFLVPETEVVDLIPEVVEQLLLFRNNPVVLILDGLGSEGESIIQNVFFMILQKVW